MMLDKFQYLGIRQGPQRFHEIEDESMFVAIGSVQSSHCWIKPRRKHLNADLVFEYSIPVVEHCIDRMGRIPF